MRAYIIRRVLLMVPTLFLVSIVSFCVMRLVPGGIADVMLYRLFEGGAEITEADRAYVERKLGVDVSIPVQYGRWLGVLTQADGSFSGIFQGDLGESMWRGTPVVDDILAAWPVTFQLGLMAMIIGQLIALPVGIYSALRQDTWGDYIGRSFAILCIAVPGFWIATLVIVFPSLWWGYMPPLVYIPFFDNPLSNLEMLIMPSIVLGMLLSGSTMRMTRAMVLEVLRQDYIRTAWAKGLREEVVVIRHVLKNALIPVITLIGIVTPVMVGGAVIIEQIFMLPGMGRLILTSLQDRDYTVLCGTILVVSVALVFINLIVDLTYGFLDPRIRYK